MELDGALCDDDQVPISVAVRVCPPPGRGPHLLPPNICVQVNTVTNELHLGPERRFVYDCVFGPNTCQEDVFATSVEPLLTPLLDGYNVTVAAYGAAGTGKTHTLVGPGPSLGPVVEEESFGLVPRAVRSLFAAVQAQAVPVPTLPTSEVWLRMALMSKAYRRCLASFFYPNHEVGVIRRTGPNLPGS